MSRFLELGHPVIALGDQDVILDGPLIVEDRTIQAVGPRDQLAQMGVEVEPFVFDFYRPWSATPVEPAYVFNAKRVTGSGA
jgi:5-methylthioadenosine/S-adenosylhomocysteine deaminase